MYKRKGDILIIEVKEDIAVLKTQQNELCRDVKAVLEKLDNINGRVRKTEQQTIRNDEAIKGMKWTLRVGLAVVGFIAGFGRFIFDSIIKR